MSKAVEDLKKLNQFESSPLPVHGIAVDYSKGHIIAPHTHINSAQLLYATAGTLLVETDAGRWLIPSNRAIWLPAQETHTVIMRSHTKVRSLFIKTNTIHKDLPSISYVVNVPPLLKELISAATLLPVDYQEDTYANLLVSLLLEELKRHTSLNLLLPWPNDARYHNICEYLIHHPTDSRSIPEWAVELHISAKTFERQFVKLTGLPFGRWRQQARLLYSLEALSEGRPIIDIAFQFGYNSHSAYSAAFKDFFGQRPSNFMTGEKTIFRV